MKEKLEIKGMTCEACKAHVTRASNSVKGVIESNVSLLNNNMTVTYDENITNINEIINSIKKAGYDAYKYNSNEIINKKDYSLIKLIFGFIFLFLIMYVSMGHMMFNMPIFKIFDMDKNVMGFSLIQFILVLPIVFLFRNYFINGFKRLIKRSPNMDTLIALGSAFSLIYGVIALFVISYGVNHNIQKYIDWHENLYFEACAMILVLVSLGKYLENISKKKTTKAIEELINLKPKVARIKNNDSELIVDSSTIKINDIIICKQGDIIPIDGYVINGNGSINEANITGEAIPKYKNINDYVYASTTVESGYLEIKCDKELKDTSFQQIIDLVNEASNSKAKISKLVDKISLIFVPMIILISLITFVFNILYSKEFDLAFNFSITVLVIACPCALGLATPVSIMVSIGKASKMGILIKNAEILENSSKISTIVFDKTGTITNGFPRVIDFINYTNIDLYSIIYNIEIKSNHPLSKAIIEFSKDKKIDLEIKNFLNLDGRGLIADINNDTYYIGNYKYYLDLGLNSKEIENKKEEFEKEGKTVLIVLKNNEIIGLISLMDTIKDNSKELISELKKLKINTILLTGDNKVSSEIIGNKIGVDRVISEVLPIDKGNIINDIKKNTNGLVAMVGDGVNDAIALTNADLGISIKGSSDVAINSSDIVLLHNNLYDILNLIKLSRRTLNTIKLCLFWAFFYNLICVIIATGVFYYSLGFKINPMIGSIAMSISSVSVILTALTINLFKGYKNEIVDTNHKKVIIKVFGMMCDKCVNHVENASKIENVLDCKANLKRKEVIIKYDNEINIDNIINNIKNEGYKVGKIKYE